ncbi:MAG: LamG domain-containing protein, partial [Kiritimatiellae bacterium]|nr:LamG domain-containing protein [Kiritimatiellia bacterium]
MVTKKEGKFFSTPKKYISCSPLEYDTDRDGMDDFYELFHGMNPLLGGASVRLDNQGPCDIVYDAWSSAGSDPIFEPWGEDDVNMWIFKVKAGDFYKTGAKPRGTGYDFEYYPWLNGLASADPDGDDIRNQAEAIMPKLAGSAWLHTDPTPLWMTDTSYERSLIRLFFRMPGRDKYVPTPGDSFTYDGVTYNFSDFGGWAPAVPLKLPERFVECKQDNWWGLYGIGASNWIASFEENEGYDTDQDALSDFEESAGELRAASDPQEANSPNRRQAMYFQGPEKPSALQLPVPVAEVHPIAGEGYPDEMTFFKFTVECWAKAESLADATLVERAIYTDPSKAGDEERVRKNFQLGIKNGKWYAKFDANGTLVSSVAELLSNGDVEVGVWYHIAATFDGSTFSLYVNGAEAATPKKTSILPEYGSSAVVVYRDSTGYRGVGDYWFDHSYSLKTIVVGASLKTISEGGSSDAFDVENAYGWKGYNRFFKGYIDEIRIWDGARTSAEIRADVETRTRYTRENALSNRLSFYKDWTSKGNRYQKDENGEDKVLTAELVYHFSFDSVPGGVDETIVAKGPTGFDYYQPATSSTTERGAAVLSR